MFLTSKYNSIIVSGLMIVLSFLMVAQAGLAESSAKALDGLNTTAGEGFGEQITKSDTNLSSIIGKIIGTGLAFIGVIFFCLILYAGFSWVLSLGNEENIKKAKDIIIASILGLLVVLGAYAVTVLLTNIFPEVIPKQ